MHSHATLFLALTLDFCTLAVPAVKAEQLPVDSMADTRSWQLGGTRVNYRLGRSSLSRSTEQVRDGTDASLKLAYDFVDERRGFLSAYWTGPAIRGRCLRFSFWVHGDGSGRPLQVTIEDAAGRWFRRPLGRVDWSDWKQLTVPVADGEGWQPVLRRGEVRREIAHPVAVRQISIRKAQEAPPEGAILLSDLRAECEVAPADTVDAALSTGRPASLFESGEPVRLRVALTNNGPNPVEGAISALVEDYFGEQDTLAGGQVRLGPGETSRHELIYEGKKLGPYQAQALLITPDRTRRWHCRFAVTQSAAEREADATGTFGCHASITSIPPALLPTAFRLNADASIRWERIGVNWQEHEPEPGRFAWLSPVTGTGPRGRCLRGSGAAPLTVPFDERLNLRDRLTLAFWVRVQGANGDWQWPVTRSTAEAGRSYGCYLSRTDGTLSFSGGFERFPGAVHIDRPADWSAWGGQWHHVASTYDADTGELSLFVDGKQARSHALNGGPIRATNAGLRFGWAFPGELDEVLLYARTLAEEEILQLAQSEEPSRKALVGWWSFDDPDDPGRDGGPHGLHAQRTEPRAARTARLAKEHGMNILGIIGFPARWASSAPDDATRPHCYKPDLQALDRHVEAVVSHYSGLIDHWEIWNEPNIRVFWEPKPDADEFMDVVRVAYAAAKRGNPDCVVMTPGLAGAGRHSHGMAFLEDLILQGLPAHTDAISIHPYRQDSPEESDIEGDLTHIASLCEQNGGRRPIWVTEWCWNTVLYGSSEKRSATMALRGIVMALSTGLLDRIIWFRLHDPGVDRYYSEHNYGLCHNDLTPKPSYFALRTAATVLDRARPCPPPDLGPEVLTRAFERDGERIVAAWSPAGSATGALFVGTPKARLVDAMGNEATADTDAGVLLLRAGESLQFVRGLDARAEGRGTPVRILPPRRAVISSSAEIGVELRNPHEHEQALTVELNAPPGFRLQPAALECVLPASGTAVQRVSVTLSDVASVGRHTISADATMGRVSWMQQAVLAVTSVKPDSGPVGHWTLDEGEGNVAHDTSPHGNHGRIAGCAWVAGRHGKALEFRGGQAPEVGAGDGGDAAVEDVVVVPDSSSLDLREEATVAFWIKVTGTTGTWQFPATKFLSNRSRDYGIYLRPEALTPAFSATFEGSGAQHTDVPAAVGLQEDQWHHVAATYSFLDQEVRVYVDGRPEGKRKLRGCLTTNDEPLRIGAGTRGVIDDLRVYPRALSPEEIAALAR